jgi:hypothetical protein
MSICKRNRIMTEVRFLFRVTAGGELAVDLPNSPTET